MGRDRTWKLEPSRWNDLSDSDRDRYAAIVASYGGSDRTHPGFRRYRSAEICARSVRNLLGVETNIGLTPAGR